MAWTVNDLHCQWHEPSMAGTRWAFARAIFFVSRGTADWSQIWPRSGPDGIGQYSPPVPLRTTVPVSGIACVVGTPLAVSAPITE